MKTAVEWLVEQLTINNYISDNAHWLIDEGKEMEKQQIIDAVEWGNRKGYEEHTLTCIYDEDEQYYNNIFNKG